MDANLIIIIVALGASLISAIVKHKNKKKQQGTMTPNQEHEAQMPKGVMGKIRKMLEEFETTEQGGNAKAKPMARPPLDHVPTLEREVPDYSKMDGREYEYVPMIERASPSPFDFTPVSQTVTTHEAMVDESTAKRIATAKLRESKIRKIETSIEFEQEENVAAIGTIKEFDLRTAVIYSEILKTKF